jgi:hypothetical protein
VTEPIAVFVNGHCVRLAPGQVIAAAIAEHDAVLGERVRAGTAYVTDGRGIRLPDDAPLHAGAILRVIVSARQTGDQPDADS